MSAPPIRRAVLAVALAALVATAGCSGSFGFGDGDGVSVESVPDDVDFVMSIDVDEMLQDSANRELVNELLDTDGAGSGPEDLEGALDDIEDDTGLDPRNADRMLAFGKTDPENQDPDGSYVGVIITGDYTTEQIVEASEQEGVSLTESEYGGKTVYEPSEDGIGAADGWIGVLGDGRYVVGTEQAVKDAIDVETGDADPISGDLLTAYEESRDGYVRFAWSVPTESIPTDAIGSQTQLNVEAFTSLDTVSGAYYTDGEEVGLSMRMRAGSEDDATDVYDVTNGAVSLVRGGTDNEEIKSALENVEVQQDGSAVTVAYSDTAGNVVDLLEAFAETGAGPPVAPLV